MTDEDKLRDMGLSQDEIDQMREEGALVSMEFDVKAARDIAARYFEIGLEAKGLELLAAAESNANYWSTKVYEVTGRSISYDEINDHWRDDVTGQYTFNPYIDIRVDDYELDQWLLNTYG